MSRLAGRRWGSGAVLYPNEEHAATKMRRLTSGYKPFLVRRFHHAHFLLVKFYLEHLCYFWFSGIV